MKTLKYLLIALIASGCSSTSTPQPDGFTHLKEYRLKGKVKSLEENSFGLSFFMGGKYDYKHPIESIRFTFFNEQGLITETSYISYEDRTPQSKVTNVYQYDGNFNKGILGSIEGLDQFIQHDIKWDGLTRTTHTYIKVSEAGNEDNTNNVSTLEFDSDFNIKIYDIVNNNTAVGKTEYSYNGDTTIMHISGDGAEEVVMYEVVLQRDEKGNPTHIAMLNKDLMGLQADDYIVRKYTYYE